MESKKPFLQLVHSAGKKLRPVPKPAGSSQPPEQEIAITAMRLPVRKQYISLQMPADFDMREEIQMVPESLGMEEIFPFDHPEDDTHYLHLRKPLSLNEGVNQRYNIVAQCIKQIREGLQDLYGDRALNMGTQGNPLWTFKFPFALKDNESLQQVASISNALRDNNIAIKSDSMLVEITADQLIFGFKAKTPNKLIDLTRSKMQDLPLLLDDLKNILL